MDELFDPIEDRLDQEWDTPGSVSRKQLVEDLDNLHTICLQQDTRIYLLETWRDIG